MSELRPPSPLLRAWRLLCARRALSAGAPERALTLLADPALAAWAPAAQLRSRAADRLCRWAEQRAEQGRGSSVARLLRLVAVQDPDLARAWRRRLLPERGTDGSPALRKAPLGELLERMRDRSAASLGAGGLRFHMAVDDGGEFLVVCGAEVTIGHSSAGLADVPLLADLESLHARLVRTESFHDGPSWGIAPLGAGRVEVNGAPVGGTATRLAGDDLVRLAANLSFAYRVPEPASASVLLDLQHGAEADGALQVLLLGPGRAGRVRIGARRSCHVPIAGLEHEVELWLDGQTLRVRCEAGVRILATDAPAAGFDPAGTECEVELPPRRRVDVLANARPSQRAPFGIALGPLLLGRSPDDSVEPARGGGA